MTFAAGGCSGGGDEAEVNLVGTEALVPVTTTTDPPSCSTTEDSSPGATAGELYKECYADRYTQALASLSTEELVGMDTEARDARVADLCEKAADASPATTSALTRPALLAELIDEPDWAPDALAELSSLARNRCPESFDYIDMQPSLRQSVLITYVVEGEPVSTDESDENANDANATAVSVEIEWVSFGARAMKESAVAPWYGEIRLDDAGDVRVDAIFEAGGGRRCAILLDGVEAVSVDLPDDAEYPQVRCRLSAAELEFRVNDVAMGSDGGLNE